MPGDAPPLEAPGFVLPDFLELAHEDQRGHGTVRAAPVGLQLGALAYAGDYVVHGELLVHPRPVVQHGAVQESHIVLTILQ